MSRGVPVDRREALVRRIVAEYQEMPGMSLTAPQAARLWGLDRQACSRLLDALVAEGQLRRTNDRLYRAA